MEMKSFILKYASKIMFYDVNIACYHWPRNLMLKFELKMNSAWSNVKLRGQMISEVDEFVIHQNLMK